MARSFHCRLVNGRFGDPVLYVQCVWERRALLFDLGELRLLRPSEILKVSDVFVSHTHIDHFIGFDHFLRIMLNRDRTVRLYGPEGLIANVAGKLAGYTWNLIDDYRLQLEVCEVSADGMRRVSFSCRDRFRARSRASTSPFTGVLLEDGRFVVEARLLDHSVPCLGFALREGVLININRDRLLRLGWEPGPWLNRLKEMIRAGLGGDEPIELLLRDGEVVRKEQRRLEEVSDAIVMTTPGTKVAYVTDIGYSPANREKVRGLAREVDILFCEAAFLERDLDHARRKNHLTARQAGEMARLAGARRLEIFHFSPKYIDEEDLLVDEACEAHRHGAGTA
jgi:ribonuclease Z